MLLHGGFAQTERVTDLLVRQTLSQEREHFALAPIELPGADPWQRLRADPSQSLSERLTQLRGAALATPGSVGS